jgi:hypothetical protein
MATRRYRWSMRVDAPRAPAFDAAPPRDDRAPPINAFGRAIPKDADAGVPGERAPTAGGVNPEKETFDTNRRCVRLSGRDHETGENYGAELWLPEGTRAMALHPRRSPHGRRGTARPCDPERWLRGNQRPVVEPLDDCRQHVHVIS